MKIIEIVTFLAVMPVFSMIFLKGMTGCREVHQNYDRSARKLEKEIFICRSFESLCSKKNQSQEDFAEWLKLCGSLWEDALICVETVGIRNSEKLLCMKFESEGEEINFFTQSTSCF